MSTPVNLAIFLQRKSLWHTIMMQKKNRKERKRKVKLIVDDIKEWWAYLKDQKAKSLSLPRGDPGRLRIALAAKRTYYDSIRPLEDKIADLNAFHAGEARWLSGLHRKAAKRLRVYLAAKRRGATVV